MSELELSLTVPTAYVRTDVNYGTVIARHLDDTMHWIPSEMQELPYTGYLNCIKIHMVLGLLRHLVNAQQNHYQGC